MRVPRESGQIVVGTVGAEVIEQQERVGLPWRRGSRIRAQAYARAFHGWL